MRAALFLRTALLASLLLALLQVLGCATPQARVAAGDGAAPVRMADPAAVADAGAEPEESRQLLVMLRLPAAHFRADQDYAGGYGGGAERRALWRVATALARERGLRLLSDWPMPVLGLDCFVMLPPEGLSPAQAAQALGEDPRVAWAQPMQLFSGRGEAVHDDPLYTLQPAAAAWHLAELHRMATGSRIAVAVVDSGVDAAHPDLREQVAWSEDFVGRRAPPVQRHGTAVAGIIAARADDGMGIAGVAPRARLMALRACWQAADDADTRCSSLTLAQALQFAIRHGAQVINLSLTGPGDRLLAELIGAALARGIAVVAAADRGLPGGGFPASHPGVVAVVDDGPAGGPGRAVRAPGRDVPTTLPGARWGLVSGASFASAHVAGLLALARELRPAGEVPAVLVRSAPGDVDACATLSQLGRPCACGCSAALPGSDGLPPPVSAPVAR